jgi:peptide/nickel transport system permease protein
MSTYILRRVLLLPLLLVGVTILIFAMLSFLTPTERSALWVREIPRNERQVEGIIRKYGLDKPIYVQYYIWLVGHQDPETGEWEGGLLRGDLGYARSASQPVMEIIEARLPNTLDLAVWAVLPIVLVGVLLGVVSAINHNRFIDQAARVFSILGWSFPTFVFALVVLMIFYAGLQWFPPGRVSDWANQVILSDEFRTYTHLLSFDSLLNGRFDIFLDVMRHMILPVITLSYLNWALMLRVTRSSMLEALRQEYVTTARSKGLKESVVIFRHALPNALIPVVTIAGFTVVALLNGVVITETIFNYPGIGRAAARAALNLDVVGILGLTLFNGLILIVANLVVDVLYAIVDPRVRLS